MKIEAIERQKNTELTQLKYFGRDFKWGSCDCAKIVAFHARKFGWKVPKTGTYKSAVGAAKALKENGVKDMPAMIGKVGLPEIAPAFAMTGDIFSFAADSQMGAVGIYLDGGKMMAFHETRADYCIIAVDMSQIERAWSVWRV